jgi:hypothetical protein
MDYVFIARAENSALAQDGPFAELAADVARALSTAQG